MGFKMSMSRQGRVTFLHYSLIVVTVEIQVLHGQRLQKRNPSLYYKLNYGYQISSIFIGSLDTGYQLVYLLYLIWSRNASAIKRAAENIFAALRKKWPTKAVLDRN